MVKSELGGSVNFEIKSQLMKELREDTFSGSKNDDAHEHMERILDIIGLFNISGVTHDVGLIPNKTPAQALDAIQTMADHSQTWHNGSTRKKVSNGSSDGIAVITSKLDSLGRDMKKLKENMHAIQVKRVEEVKYGEFGRSFPNNGGNEARYRVSKETEEEHFRVMLCQLPPKELSPRSFTLPCTIGFGEDMIVFYMNGNMYHLVVLVEKVCMVSEVQEEESFNPLEISDDLFSYDSLLCLEIEKYNHLHETNQNNEDTFVRKNVQELLNEEKGKTKMAEPGTTTLRLHYCKRLQVLRNGEFEFWPICTEIARLMTRSGQEGTLSGVENNKHQDYGSTSVPYLGDYNLAPRGITNPNHQEDPILSMKSYFPNSSQLHPNKPRLREYSFQEWLKVKIGYTNVNKYVKSMVLNKWILDSFDVEADFAGICNDP
ncbi:hypothetical protein Tco_0170144 [Tanacetum coccineum]